MVHSPAAKDFVFFTGAGIAACTSIFSSGSDCATYTHFPVLSDAISPSGGQPARVLVAIHYRRRQHDTGLNGHTSATGGVITVFQPGGMVVHQRTQGIKLTQVFKFQAL